MLISYIFYNTQSESGAAFLMFGREEFPEDLSDDFLRDFRSGIFHCY